MKKSAYGKPILIDNKKSYTINRYENVDELTIQNLVFEHPECIPISDIDESFNPIIPVCKELNTPVGPLDILMTTPNGDIVVVETKLWRNPDARRKVVAQILDYANELSKWSYEDLQREINRVLKTKGNTLFSIANKSEENYSLSESDFVDTVSRNLRRGKFLLLIIGDGIREGASSIANFLLTAGNLNFTLSMVELTIYKLSDNTQIILPRTIVKTTEIQKLSIELADGLSIVNNDSLNSLSKNIDKDEKASKVDTEKRAFYLKFWNELISELVLDDPGQTLPKPTHHQNIYIYPANNKNCWISAYFMQSDKRVGVYFRFHSNELGREMADHFSQNLDWLKEEIKSSEVTWPSKSTVVQGFSVRLPVENVYSEKNREDIKDFFKYWINTFVNAVRPLLKDF